jgi:hypothetical protein
MSQVKSLGGKNRLCSILDTTAKITSLSKKKSFQKPQRHDPLGALSQTIVLMMLLHDSSYD